MFTLKLYRRLPELEGAPNSKMSKTLDVFRVVTTEIGKDGHALELCVFLGSRESGLDYETYYVGVPEIGMDAFGKENLHLDSGDGSWWGWGLLENSSGNTTEHYRPASYG